MSISDIVMAVKYGKIELEWGNLDGLYAILPGLYYRQPQDVEVSANKEHPVFYPVL